MLRKIPYKTLSHCVGKIRDVFNYLNVLFNEAVHYRDYMCCWWMEECGALILTGGKYKCWQCTTVPRCPQQIRCWLAWDWTQASAVRGRRLTAWAMTQQMMRVVTAVFWMAKRVTLCLLVLKSSWRKPPRQEVPWQTLLKSDDWSIRSIGKSVCCWHFQLSNFASVSPLRKFLYAAFCCRTEVFARPFTVLISLT